MYNPLTATGTCSPRAEEGSWRRAGAYCLLGSGSVVDSLSREWEGAGKISALTSHRSAHTRTHTTITHIDPDTHLGVKLFNY